MIRSHSRPRPGSVRARLAPRLAALLLASASLLPLVGAQKPPKLPPIVFVARERIAGSTLVPGVGPAGRAWVTRGKLFVREPDARVHELLPPGRFVDVSDPAVSYDGRTIAFAAVTGRDSAWRLWCVNASGRDLRPLTRSDRAIDLAARYGAQARRFTRYDDFDPCWLPDGRVVFSSTRYPMLAQQGGVVSNLWVVGADGSDLKRLTSERDGAEEPSVDPNTGRIIYARWWFSRYLAMDDSSGITLIRDVAMPGDTVDLWQAVTVDRDGDRLRLYGGDPRVRAGAYQPVVMADSSLLGVRAERGSMSRPSRMGLQRFAPALSAAKPLYGLGAEKGWSACAPVALPDGRILFAMDEDGTGNFSLFVCDADGKHLDSPGDIAGAMELDPAVLAARPLPPLARLAHTDTPDALPPVTAEQLLRDPRTARFDCLNVFANGPVDGALEDAIPIQRDTRIRFFGVLSRPEREGGDSLVLVREAKVTPQGAVHVDEVPADQPLFEQLVDAHGRVLRSGSGPAHVTGFNYTRPGAGTQCVGCHTGHSSLPVAPSAGEGEWTNVSPSAKASATSEHRECAGAKGAVDRLTLGDPTQVAWVADELKGQNLRLEWNTDLDARALILYAFKGPSKDGGLVRVGRSEVVLFLRGHEVGRIPVRRELDPKGTRVEFPITRLDAIEVRLLNVAGSFRKRPVAALAEVETIARLAWE